MKSAFRFGLLVFLGLTLVACELDDDQRPPDNIRDRYLGTWEVTETTGINHPQFYLVDIVAGLSPDEIEIRRLYNLSGVRLQAFVDGTRLDLPTQSSDGIQFSGSGQANSDFSQINLSFTANDGSGPDRVDAVLVP